MSVELYSLLVLGFGLGGMHAFDADHVMAISVLNNGGPDLGRTLKFVTRWALGHATVLFAVAGLLFGLQLAMNPMIQQVAETGAGLLLIGAGIFCLWNFEQRKLSLKFHRHGSLVHRHWHYPGDVTGSGHRASGLASGGHTPVMVGVLHGLAGSAPVLALIPAVSGGQLELALAYTALFSCGVLISMLAIGFGWTGVQKLMYRQNRDCFEWSRRITACGAVVLGLYWLLRAV